MVNNIEKLSSVCPEKFEEVREGFYCKTMKKVFTAEAQWRKGVKNNLAAKGREENLYRNGAKTQRIIYRKDAKIDK